MAVACSRIYFAMESLAQVHFLYQFSLRFFLDIFYELLNNNTHLEGVKEPSERLKILIRDLFQLVFKRVSRTLLHDDYVTFALQIAYINLKGTPSEIDEGDYEFLLRGGDNLSSANVSFSKLNGLLSLSQQKFLAELQNLPAFSKLADNLVSSIDQWSKFMTATDGEAHVPESWLAVQKELTKKSSDILTLFYRLLLLKAFRPDRLLTGASAFVAAVFGENFLSTGEQDLAKIVEKESKSSAPILFCSAPGYDASSKVEDLAVEMRKQYKSIAIGSPEGFDLAEKSIQAAAKGGTWVLLKNIHLAPQWLVTLEKKLHTLSSHVNFRLFMTSEIHPNLPPNLLRQSHIFSYEPPPGIKANLKHTFAALNATRMEKHPVERSRLYFLLAWFHAVIQERLRYLPMGWTKIFEFNDADQRGALDCIDYWVDLYAKGRTNIAPEKIPWVALRTILGQTIYGGRVDNEFDMRLLNSFLEQLFTPHSFDPDFPLTHDTSRLTVPEGTTRGQFLKWIEALPEQSTPAWLGLPDNAEVLVLSNKGKKVIYKLSKMHIMDEDDAPAASQNQINQPQEAPSDGRPSWIRAVEATVTALVPLMPAPISRLKRTAQNIKDPLFRCFEREVATASKLLNTVTSDLKELIEVCKGNAKQSNYMRSLMTSISKGMAPKEWKKYSIPESVTLNQWITDFVRRMQQQHQISQTTDFRAMQIWVGGLLNPEAFITATRQAAAQSHGWSLENLKLFVETMAVKKDESNDTLATGVSDNDGFTVRGLSLEGASWENNALSITTLLSVPLAPVRFLWKNQENKPLVANNSSAVAVPVYLSETRHELLFSIDLEAPPKVAVQTWFQRGVGIISWKLDS